MTIPKKIEHKILAWKVEKFGDEDYRVIRPHKFVMIVDEYDTEVFKNRAMAEEKAKILNATSIEEPSKEETIELLEMENHHLRQEID